MCKFSLEITPVSSGTTCPEWVAQYDRNIQKVVDMNILTINKQCSKLKIWCSKTPNFSYCHRCVSPKKESNILNEK